MGNDKPNDVEKEQDKEYKKLRREGKDPLEAANEAVPPETTEARAEGE